MNDRFKFRVYHLITGKYVDDGETEILLQNTGLLLFGNWHNDIKFVQSEYEIEQCIGLKDKNGKLIYEGDVVLGASGFKYCVIWSEMELGWTLQNLETKLCIAMNAFTPDEIEIIGNIHEQAEQKD